ncbi:Hypothetical_protein [Hexamita inflata]|uniref:Hypothetical_protein n=1 Tax=Hexamita inflata TaxID=28002 RepID=A0AA86UU86_9EUKA|nr:Hypothetical protein HINF_LOCUS55814 [Hexamita inflata]
MLAKYNKYSIIKTSARINQAIIPKIQEANKIQQPRLRNCISVVNVVKQSESQVKDNQFITIQTKQEKWNELISDDSEFDTQATNMTQIFSSFNLINEQLVLQNMIKQNINGLNHKNQRLDDMLVLVSSQQASLENIQCTQMRYIGTLTGILD